MGPRRAAHLTRHISVQICPTYSRRATPRLYQTHYLLMVNPCDTGYLGVARHPRVLLSLPVKQTSSPKLSYGIVSDQILAK